MKTKKKTGRKVSKVVESLDPQKLAKLEEPATETKSVELEDLQHNLKIVRADQDYLDNSFRHNVAETERAVKALNEVDARLDKKLKRWLRVFAVLHAFTIGYMLVDLLAK